ncbi:MAG: patatin-like phospholipase family protein [Bacillota bacterium]|nr:patatin-like phospholipase family protein [Bacillota bacterium]
MRPKVGLALGAGAARGLAHLGVLEVLVREGIPIDYLTGTSAGALVGGVFAAGADLLWTERLVCHLEWEHLVQLVVPRMGFVRADQLLQLLRLLTKGKTFAELEIPFAAVAVDIESGEEVILQEGPVAEAILASASVPGVFEPQRWGGRLLVDGGVLNRVPIDVVRRLGAEVVVAVDVGLEETVTQVKNIIGVMNQSFEIMQREIARFKAAEPADVLIRPDLGRLSGYRLEAAASIIEAGRVAAEAALPAIRQAVEEKTPTAAGE